MLSLTAHWVREQRERLPMAQEEEEGHEEAGRLAALKIHGGAQTVTAHRTAAATARPQPLLSRLQTVMNHDSDNPLRDDSAANSDVSTTRVMSDTRRGAGVGGRVPAAPPPEQRPC
eukprot:1968494-Rhodomonas_salina.1